MGSWWGVGEESGGVSCCGDFERRRRENFVIFNTVVKGNPSIERAAGAKILGFTVVIKGKSIG